nr:MAG TPA: hypothetical protein [Caudoviricetes sp.]
MSLYKLVTTENVDLNYKAFKKDELIDCILNLRTTYFRLKKENEENEQLKDNWNKLKKYINEANEDLYWTNNYDDILYIMQELEGSDSNE